MTTALETKLRSIIDEEPYSIRADVAKAALAYYIPEVFFEDLMRCGCASGMVGGLIYLADTHAFFDFHYAEIEGLREEMEANTGMPLEIKGDLKNFLAWFAFEEIATRMATDDLGLES